MLTYVNHSEVITRQVLLTLRLSEKIYQDGDEKEKVVMVVGFGLVLLVLVVAVSRKLWSICKRHHQVHLFNTHHKMLFGFGMQ